MFSETLSDALRGAKMELSIVDRSGKVANFHAMYEDIVGAMQEAIIDTATETQRIAYELCPVDTGFMREHIKIEASEQLQTWEIGWFAADFFDAGLDFYPQYVVLGTRFVAPRDPLTPAFAETRPMYQERITALVQMALERRRAT